MSTLQSIAPAHAAPAKGPYSPGMRAGNLLFVSGQIAVAPDGSSLAQADLETQARHQSLANLRAVLEAGGGTQQVAKVTVYLAEPDGCPVFNPIYAEFLGAHKPARAIVPVAAFPGGFKVEVDAVAVLPG